MPDLSPNSLEHNPLFFIVPRAELRQLVESSGIGSGDLLLDSQVWKQRASRFAQFGPRDVRAAEELAKALFLRWTWESLGWKGKETTELSKFVNRLIGGQNLTLATFDRYWEMTTFHGTDDCQNILRRLAAESKTHIDEICSMISERAATWIDDDLLLDSPS